MSIRRYFEEYDDPSAKRRAQRGAKRGKRTGKANGYLCAVFDGGNAIYCRASAVGWSPGAVQNCSVDALYLRTTCRRIARREVPADWLEAIDMKKYERRSPMKTARRHASRLRQIIAKEERAG